MTLTPIEDEKELREEIASLSKIELDILKVWLDGDCDYCYPYKTFENYTGYDIKQLKTAMKLLRDKGHVYYARGLMDEDGQVAGSGHGIEWKTWSALQDIFEHEIERKHELENIAYSLKYTCRDTDEVIQKLNTYTEALIEKAVKEARIKAQLGMVEYYDQCSDNADMDWKGLFADNRKVLEYELAELEQKETNDGTQ